MNRWNYQINMFLHNVVNTKSLLSIDSIFIGTFECHAIITGGKTTGVCKAQNVRPLCLVPSRKMGIPEALRWDHGGNWFKYKQQPINNVNCWKDSYPLFLFFSKLQDDQGSRCLNHKKSCKEASMIQAVSIE